MSTQNIHTAESAAQESAGSALDALVLSENPLAVTPPESQEREVIVLPGRLHNRQTSDVRQGFAKAPVLRRAAAQFIDRLLPLPFLAALFWPWLLVVIGYELFRDACGASVGKRLMGLQTVIVAGAPSGRPCNPGRSFLRNLGGGAARILYIVPFLIPVALTMDLIEILLAALSPTGRRAGDLLAGTQVIAREN